MSSQALGRYQLLTRLTVGGMAELFLAYVPGPGGFRKFVAIKRILPALRGEEEFLAMFLDEARISAALSHANIVQVYDLAEERNELFIAMEFIAGLDLHLLQRWAGQRKVPVPLGLVARVVRDACHALHYAHTFTSPSGREVQVIHRDLSLRNLMLTYSGATKVIDFGIAKAMGSLSTTKVGKLKGSLAYMSPEQVRGEALTGRSDLFGLGVVLYELLTGVKPFAAADDPAIMFRVLNHDPPPPTALSPEVGEALSEVVLRAMAKDPAARYPSAREMAKALEAAAGERMLDEEATARWLSEHFADAVKKTREMLALAGEQNQAQVDRAAERLSALAERDSASASVDDSEAPTSTDLPRFSRKTATIMVVDDSRVGRAMVETVLTGAGHQVVSATSGEEALESLEQLAPDLLILDINMPGMDGFELCAAIRSNPNLVSTPVIFLSAACSLAERQKGLQVGGDDFLRKPFAGAELIDRVRQQLQRMAVSRPVAPRGAVGPG